MKYNDLIGTPRPCQYPDCQQTAIYEQIGTYRENTASRWRSVVVVGSFCDTHKAELPNLDISFHRCGGFAYIEAVRRNPERDVLLRCLALFEAKSEADTELKEAKRVLDEQVFAHYKALTEDEIKALVVGNWFEGIRADIQDEFQQVMQELAIRVEDLQQRYAQPLPELEDRVQSLATRVENLMQEMGIEVQK